MKCVERGHFEIHYIVKPPLAFNFSEAGDQPNKQNMSNPSTQYTTNQLTTNHEGTAFTAPEDCSPDVIRSSTCVAAGIVVGVVAVNFAAVLLIGAVFLWLRLLLMSVVGCRLLVVGCWLLVIGCWLLVVGCWLLVVGCWLLVVVDVVVAGCGAGCGCGADCGCVCGCGCGCCCCVAVAVVVAGCCCC